MWFTFTATPGIINISAASTAAAAAAAAITTPESAMTQKVDQS